MCACYCRSDKENEGIEGGDEGAAGRGGGEGRGGREQRAGKGKKGKVGSGVAKEKVNAQLCALETNVPISPFSSNMYVETCNASH